MALRLTEGETNRLFHHYSGNCMMCTQCAFYDRIQAKEPGAVEEYVAYMKETHNRTVKVEEIPG